MTINSWPNKSLRVTSRWINTVFMNGYATETISGRAWKEGWWLTKWALDAFWAFLGEKNHCFNSWKIDSTHADSREVAERRKDKQKQQ